MMNLPLAMIFGMTSAGRGHAAESEQEMTAEDGARDGLVIVKSVQL